MSRRVKVPLFQTARPVEIDPAATYGAIVGQNLLLPDGTVVTAEMIINPAQEPGQGNQTLFWRLIQEVPVNVRALADHAGVGLYTITGTGTAVTREIVSDTLVVQNANGVGGNPRIEEKRLTLPAGETIHGRRIVRVQGGEVFHPLLANTIDALTCLGIALNAAAEGDDVVILQRGRHSDSGWSFVPGPVYCDDSGILTQAAPVSGWVLPVGVAVDETTIDVNLLLPVIRS